MAVVVTVNDVLDGHVALDLQLPGSDLSEQLCTDSAGGRAGGVVYDHAPGLSDSVPGDHGEDRPTFRKAVEPFAADNTIPVVRFGKGDRKIDVMRCYVAAQVRTARSGVRRLGWPKNSRTCSPPWSTTARPTSRGFRLPRPNRRATCFYFAL
jgi:hypothetical protein